MSEFVRNSLTTLEATVEELISEIPRGAKIGIFGTYDSAQLIHLSLRRAGHRNLRFIKSGPRMSHLCHSPIIDSTAEMIAGLDIVITSSLASSEQQKAHLLEMKFQGRIICLPDLKYLAIALLRDPATNNRIKGMESGHAGRPAFIIGNGPSLSDTNPHRIGSPFLTFAGNGIVKLNNFNPDFYFAIDQSAVTMWKSQIAALPSQLFFPSNLRGVLEWELPEIIRNTVFFPLCYEQHGEMDVRKWGKFGFESGHTVICPMLQFALLFGCSPIYIIGVDISYTPTKANYFSESYHQAGIPIYSESKTQFINARMHRSLERVTRSISKAGIEIYNCSPTRNLPYVENISFDEALARHRQPLCMSGFLANGKAGRKI